ncbi:striatin-4-like [Notechis scutatus]|uniref:Striatin-4-like n=1 Tax=Notechis scutatus TaxID=8663 RepID=A0A6J1W9C3_9SAUR|nr:striatin-4-like [Notechis scutatus]
MLEYALKQERSKYHKLKFGTDLNQGEKKPEASEPVSNGPAEPLSLENSPFIWKEGRQLLRQYLEEVGYTDTILDMRSKRVRSLLGRCSMELNGAAEASGLSPGPALAATSLNGGESLLVKQIEEQIKRNAGKEVKERVSNPVMEKIPFLRGCEDDDSDEEEDLEGLSLETQRQHKKQRVKVPPLLPEPKFLGCRQGH